MAISTMFFQFIVIKKLFFGPYGKPPAAPNCLTVFSEALGLGAIWDSFKKLGAAGGFAPGLRIYQILALNGLFKLYFQPFTHVPGGLQCLCLKSGSKQSKVWKKLTLMIFIYKKKSGNVIWNGRLNPIFPIDAIEKAAPFEPPLAHPVCLCGLKNWMWYQ